MKPRRWNPRGLEVARQALERGRLRRVVYVPGRIINIVSA
jgi:hypothetical protein